MDELRTTGPQTGPPASPGRTVAVTVGVDVGGTTIATVVLDEHGAVVAHAESATPTGATALATAVADAVQDVVARAGLTAADVLGVGVGVPGVVDPEAGTVTHAVNLGIEGSAPLAVLVADELVRTGLGRVRVRVENDLNAAVLGAAHELGSRADAPADDLAFVALGTGLAAGLMLDGRLRRGPHRAAGEIGHLRYVPDGLPCKCGQSGCLERYASGSALDAAWGASRTGRPAPVEVFEAADAGDERAVVVRDEFVAAVAAAVRILVLTCDLGRIVVGGGVSQLGEPLLRALTAELERQAVSSPFLAAADLPNRVQLAPVGVPIGAIGAALVGRGER